MRRTSLRTQARPLLALAVAWLFLSLGRPAPSPSARAEEAKPARKDTSARMRPKELTAVPSIKPAEARPGDTVTYQVAVKIQPGWHIYQYAKTDPDNPRPGPVNTSLDLFETGGLKPVGDWTASRPPLRKTEAVFENMTVESFEDEVTWSLKLKVPPGTEPGKKVLRAQLGFQICNAVLCKNPVRMTLPEVSLTVLPAGEAASAAPPSPSPSPAPPSTSPQPAGSQVASSADKPEASPPVSEVAQRAEKGLVPFLLFSAGGGLLALVMPCVWPMVPITVNFFVKQGQHHKGKTTGLAIAYCLAIIGVFTSLGVLVSFFFSATALQNLANNPWLNAVVAGLFLAFGLSLLGLFEVRLPNFLLNASARGESRGGMAGVMFMALTLTITSFTCTFPVVGGLIVMAAGGQFFYPIVGLATFSAVLAFPFFLLALAPGLISRMPKGGDWMNAVKVVGGLVEIGAALKFVNTAEIGFGAVPEDAWFDAPLVLSVWVGLAAVSGLYLLGVFRTDHDHDEVKIGPGRLLGGSLSLALALFLAPALFGHPPRSPLWDLIVGILPADVDDLQAPSAAAPGSEGERRADSHDPETALRQEKRVHGVVWGMSYDAALEEARARNKPVLIDFTGVNCANCRAMEQSVMPRREVVGLLSRFVTVQVYTDAIPIASLSKDQRDDLVEKNQLLQLDLTRDSSNPFYVAVNPDGQVLASKGGKVAPSAFIAFLNEALSKHQGRAQGKVAQVVPPS